MTRSFRLAGFALALALPAAMPAQTTRPVSIGASGGLSVPTGDLGDRFESGFSLAGHVYFKPASFTSLRFRGDVTFDRFSGKGPQSDAVNRSFRSLGVVANAVYDFPMQNTASVIRPYVIGGLGLFNTNESANNFDGDSESGIGVQVGGGLQFRLSGFTTFLEAKFVNVFADSNRSYIPITFGVRF